MKGDLVEIDVRGRPRAQGSIRYIGHGKGVYSDNVYEWRHLVFVEMKNQAKGVHLNGPIELHLTFELKRPQSHFLNGKKTAGLLSPSAPRWPTKKPDLDKLTRAICDAATDARLWKDDSQVVFIHTTKHYSDDDNPGVKIVVREQ